MQEKTELLSKITIHLKSKIIPSIDLNSKNSQISKREQIFTILKIHLIILELNN